MAAPMTMDFFELQHTARKRTLWLVALFALAVAAITAAVYLLIVLVINVTLAVNTENLTHSARRPPPPSWWQPQTALYVSAGVLVIVVAGSLYKMAQLRAGGHVVAESLGGRRLDPGTRDADERRLLNVVEEMAIASGMPVPPVYLLDKERGINAFAAGLTRDDAVIGVTDGCIRHLNRDELQGVIAHEFSHILNGDMRLNLRLIGIIHGIVLIGMVGWILLRSAGRSSSSRSSRGSPLPAILVGLGLMLVGYVGTFFGHLIRAAVSRQREYLADAAAVQFTRNPRGIAGALKKIGGWVYGSRVDDPHSSQAAHMFFGRHAGSMLGSALSTHPPLVKRIRQIEPDFDGTFPRILPNQPPRYPAGAVAATAARPAAEQTPAVSALAALALIGQPTAAHLEHARRIIDSLPRELRDSAREPVTARAIIYAMLLGAAPNPRQSQLQRLQQHADPDVYRQTLKLAPIVAGLDRSLRLPLLDMAVPALAALSPQQYTSFRANVRALIEADERIDLFEWVLGRILLRHLDPRFAPVPQQRVNYYSLKQLGSQCATLLATLAYAGHADRAAAARAFDLGASRLGLGPLTMPTPQQMSLAALDEALDVLATVAPRLRRTVLEAAAICVAADRSVNVDEAELLRAIADALDCPMPPVLAGQPLVADARRG